MAPRDANIVSSDEDDAPESLSLTQSRQHIKSRDDELKKIQTAERDKKRARNKERDRRLKEQAENSKRKRNEAQGGDPDLVARMERAMQEAQMEMDDGDDEDEDEEEHDGEHMGDGDDEEGEDDEEEEGEEEEEDEGGEDEEFKGIQASADGSDEDEHMSSSDAESSQSATKSKVHPNHLPDHLFSSAFNTQISKSAPKRKANKDGPVVRSRKRTRSTALSKDVIIGGRAIRTLKQGGPPSAVGMIPSTKAKKFLDRSLGLKGGKNRTRGWERRPASIGAMRSNGPASSFVRSR